MDPVSVAGSVKHSGASFVSSALPGQSSVSLIKKTAPWSALPPDP